MCGLPISNPIYPVKMWVEGKVSALLRKENKEEAG